MSHLLSANQVSLAGAMTILRLTLHVLAATVWVGGQFVVAGLVPTARALGEDAPRKVAAAFARLAWPAYGLLLVTGIWNYAAINHASASSSWNSVFGIKMTAVLLAGLGVALHTRATTAKARGLYAAVGLLASVAALVMGVALAG